MVAIHLPRYSTRARDKALRELDHRALVALLTERQRQTLVLLCKGYSAEEAAKLNGCAKHTECTHRQAVYRRLDVNSGPEAAVIAAKAGLV